MPRFAERDLCIHLSVYRRGGIAKTFAAIFAPSPGAAFYIRIREHLLAPFGGPTRFAPRSRDPLTLEMRLPRPPLRISQTHPDEVKILVQQNAAMLACVPLQFGIQHDQAPPDVGFGICVVPAAIPETAAVPDSDFSAIEQIG